jgi:hypothetical protein
MSEPAISVVVVPLGGAGDLDRCLHSLARQDCGGVEVIVANEGATPAAKRAAGVARARGAVIALTEDHCLPGRGWCSALLAAHRADHVAVGGPVEKIAPDTALNWAIYLADYLRYAPPVPAGVVDHLTDCNVSYKREALEARRALWAEEFHENVVHDALRVAGGTLWLEPEAVVGQRRSFRGGEAIRDRYDFGRLFASTRVAGAPISRRAVWMLTAIPLPALLIARVAGHVLRKRRHYGEFLRALPWLALVSAAWAVGEVAGYATGRAR